MADIDRVCISPEQTIWDAIRCIDKNVLGIALIVDPERRLIGTITDGDIRRAMLAGDSLDTPVLKLLERRVHSPYPQPVTARQGATPEMLLKLMRERSVRQIPILDEGGRVVEVVTMDELIPPGGLPVEAVIMAGGLGTRLRPLTDEVPKPMLPVGEKPLMELIVAQLRSAGIRHVNVTTHYKPEVIREYFGDGERFGIEMNYINEDTPLGTGGALSLLPPSDQPLLVINGDILTQVDFRTMLAFHQEQRADLTIAVRRYELQVPYGVIECDGPRVTGISEKPQLSFFVNAGIYLLEPTVYPHIPHGRPFNMPDLIEWLLQAGLTVASFPVHEYWLDIGQHADYLKAQDDLKNFNPGE